MFFIISSRFDRIYSVFFYTISCKNLVDLWLTSLCVCFTPEIHRELLHRPVSGYVPEEIWKKAGEPPNLNTHTGFLSLSLYSSAVFKTFYSIEIKAIFFTRMTPGWRWLRGAPLNPILPSNPNVVCCLQLPPPVDLN